MFKKSSSAAVFVASLACVVATDGAVLYDASANTTPESQGWLSYYSLPGTAVRTLAVGKMTYDTTPSSSERGGVSSHTLFGSVVNAAFPTLDRTTGFTIDVDMRLLAETHSTANRAGTSLIVLSSDHMGIELGFWADEIWAQSGPTFTHAEGIARNTLAAGNLPSGQTRYELSVLGSNYTLSADGAPVLTGPLRDYSSFGLPYNLTNYLFLGDDTTSAAASTEISRIAVTIPEPTIATTLATPLLLLARGRRK